MKKIVAALGTVTLILGISVVAEAASVNIDFEGGTADTTHVGADGIYSTTGTVWTSVLPNVNAANLPNEFGAPTNVGVNFTGNTFGVVDALSTNNLQDSGVQASGLQIVGLLPNNTYDIAGYIRPNAGFRVIDATGDLGFVGFGDPTYVLPGIETISGGQEGDYALFSNLIPANLGGANFGITINTDGALTGLQILGVTPIPEPATTLLLALGLLGVGLGRGIKCRPRN